MLRLKNILALLLSFVLAAAGFLLAKRISLSYELTGISKSLCFLVLLLPALIVRRYFDDGHPKPMRARVHPSLRMYVLRILGFILLLSGAYLWLMPSSHTSLGVLLSVVGATMIWYVARDYSDIEDGLPIHNSRRAAAPTIAKPPVVSTTPRPPEIVKAVTASPIQPPSVEQNLPVSNFQYVPINEKALAELEALNLQEPVGRKKVALEKWCVNDQNTIAVVYIGWVSDSIARTNEGHNFWYFLMLVGGVHIRIELIRTHWSIDAATHPVSPNEIGITADLAAKTKFTVQQLNTFASQAINVIDIGQNRDRMEERKRREDMTAAKTPVKIMYGAFSPLLRECVASISELPNMEHVFRSLCYRHFKEHNVAIQRYHQFLLHGDDDSLFIFDVILWMYLHSNKAATVEQFLSDYAAIANPKYQYLSDEFEENFSIPGAISFLKDQYISQRTQEEAIVVTRGKIEFAPQYVETIISRLNTFALSLRAGELPAS